MGIEARGAKYAYVSKIGAARQIGALVRVSSSMFFDVADSDEEAFGRGTRAAYLRYPEADGWSHQTATGSRIDNVDWVGRFDLGKIEAAE